MYTCTYDCDYLKKNHAITKSSFFKIGNLKQKHILINIFQKEKEKEIKIVIKNYLDIIKRTKINI